MILFGNNLNFGVGEIYPIVLQFINFCVDYNFLFERLLIIFSIGFISIGLIILFNSIIDDLKYHIILEASKAVEKIGKVIAVGVVSGLTRSAVDYGLKANNDNSGNKSGDNSNDRDNSKDNSSENKSEGNSNSDNNKSGK